jgi:hypothetical protein
MKLRCSRFSTLVAVVACVVSGCVSSPQNGGENRATEVKIYEPAQLAQGQYELVRYLPVDSWRTVFWLPTYSSQAEGIASLQADATRLGANGLINVSCLDQGSSIWSWSREPSVLCYGNAIRVRRNKE